jgi:hypothetical protein
MDDGEAAGPGTFAEHLAGWCIQAQSLFSPPAAARLAAVARQLAEPLRVAVTGRYGCGTSTIVDALLGRRVTRHASEPVTRVMVEYRFGRQTGVTLVRRDGECLPMALTADGRLPPDLAVPVTMVHHLDVVLDAPALRDMTVVDLPGLTSGWSIDPEPTAAPIDSDLDTVTSLGLGTAEAVVYVYARPVPTDGPDARRAVEAVEALQGCFGNSRDNTVGVLTAIDRLVATGDDPWRIADLLAQRQATLFGAAMNDVVPVAGVLARATACGLSSVDRAGLHVLAEVPGVGADARVTAAALRSRPPTVPAPTWDRLFDSLSGYGAAFAAYLLAHTPTMTDQQLTAQLRRASGLLRLRACLNAQFAARREILKTRRAILDLERLAAQAPSLERELLRDHLERLLPLWRY